MHHYEQGFLQDICDHPEDLAARLAYADWLMEQADTRAQARGELIAVQCTLEEPGLSGERRRELRRREKDLLGAHGEAWAEPVKPYVASWTFRRGFIEAVAVEVETLYLEGADLFRLAPLRELHVRSTTPGDVEVLAGLPLLRQITTLRLRRASLSPEVLRVLVSSPELSALRQLDLTDNPLGDAGARVLPGSALFFQLSQLHLGRTGLTAEGVRRLLLALREHVVAGGQECRLERLSLRGSRLSFAELQQTARHWLASIPPEHQGWADRLATSLANQGNPRAARQVAGQLGGASFQTLHACLDSSRREIRLRAARLLPRSGMRPEISLRPLVCRLLEGAADPSLREAVSDLAQQTRPPLRAWLALLNPPGSAPQGGKASVVLETLVKGTSRALPRPVQQELREMCERRRRWRARFLSRPRPEATPPPSDTQAPLSECVEGVLRLAGEHAVRHFPHEASPRRLVAAREREAAWLVSWIYHHLQLHLADQAAS